MSDAANAPTDYHANPVSIEEPKIEGQKIEPPSPAAPTVKTATSSEAPAAQAENDAQQAAQALAVSLEASAQAAKHVADAMAPQEMPAHTATRSLLITPGTEALAEKALAQTVWSHLFAHSPADREAVSKDLNLTVSNRKVKGPEHGALDATPTDMTLEFHGPMVKANFSLLQEQIQSALAQNPVIKNLLTHHKMEIDADKADGNTLHVHIKNMPWAHYKQAIDALAQGHAFAPVASHAADLEAAGPHNNETVLTPPRDEAPDAVTIQPIQPAIMPPEHPTPSLPGQGEAPPVPVKSNLVTMASPTPPPVETQTTKEKGQLVTMPSPAAQANAPSAPPTAGLAPVIQMGRTHEPAGPGKAA